MSETSHCNACGESLRSSADFCPYCGEETERARSKRRESRREQLQESNSATRALAVIFAGTLFGMILISFSFQGAEMGALAFCAYFAMDLCVGFAGAWALTGHWRLALTVAERGAKGVEFARACGIGFAMIAVGWLYVTLIQTMFPGAEEVASDETVWIFLQVLVAAPLLEEWLCRGVLWEASARILNVKGTIVLTAALFAMLHMLNGAWFLETPHRFVGGLMLGWLRHRSGSIWPGVAAHGLNNNLAYFV